MSPIILKSLAIVLVSVSAPAFAAPYGTQAKTVLKYDAKTRKYCATEPAITGSRISPITCMTAAQWSAAGLDMPKPVAVAQK